MKTLERSPPMPEPECAGALRPTRRVIKPFKIEFRYIGKLSYGSALGKLFSREWSVWKSYESKRGQMDAYRGLTNKGQSFGPTWEYRLAEIHA